MAKEGVPLRTDPRLRLKGNHDAAQRALPKSFRVLGRYREHDNCVTPFAPPSSDLGGLFEFLVTLGCKNAGSSENELLHSGHDRDVIGGRRFPTRASPARHSARRRSWKRSVVLAFCTVLPPRHDRGPGSNVLEL